MSIYRNYDNRQAGGVNANAFPRVHPIPWVPSQNNVRANPNIPSQPQRVQPQERGTYYPTSASGSGTLAPQMSAGCSGCGCGGGGATPDITVSSQATAHAFPGGAGKISAPPVMSVPRPQPRGVGALRSTIRPAKQRISLTTSSSFGRY